MGKHTSDQAEMESRSTHPYLRPVSRPVAPEVSKLHLLREMSIFDWLGSGEFIIGTGLVGMCYMPREDMLVA